MYTINKGQYAIIRKFSEQGKEKEVIVVPKEIDGYKVVQYGDTLRAYTLPRNEFMESDKLKRIYFTDSSVHIAEYCGLRSCKNLKYIFFIGEVDSNDYIDWINKDGLMIKPSTRDCDVFIYSQIYEAQFKNAEREHTLPGNVTYYYNYENAPNDEYYWLDNYDYGEKIQYQPENPTREGYVFGGWYTESDCVDKWDFETCTLPEGLFDDDGKEVFQETKLFAKWVKGE